MPLLFVGWPWFRFEGASGRLYFRTGPEPTDTDGVSDDAFGMFDERPDAMEMRSVFMAYTGGFEISGLRFSGGGDGSPVLQLDFEFGVDKPEFARLQTHMPLHAGEDESVRLVRGAGMNGEDLNACRFDREGGASHVRRSPIVMPALLGGRAVRGKRHSNWRRKFPQTPPPRQCLRDFPGTSGCGQGYPFRNTSCLVEIDQLADAASDLVGAESPLLSIFRARTARHSLMARTGTVTNACGRSARRQWLPASRQPAGATGGQANKQNLRAMTELQKSPTPASAHEYSLAKSESVEVKDAVCVDCIPMPKCPLNP